jgi:hypothetical protein
MRNHTLPIVTDVVPTIWRSDNKATHRVAEIKRKLRSKFTRKHTDIRPVLTNKFDVPRLSVFAALETTNRVNIRHLMYPSHSPNDSIIFSDDWQGRLHDYR